MMTHRKKSHPSIVQACTKFQDNCCKFQDEYCWFSHQGLEEEDSLDDNEEGLGEKDKEDIVDKAASVFQKVLKNPKPPLKTADQNQQ